MTQQGLGLGHPEKQLVPPLAVMPDGKGIVDGSGYIVLRAPAAAPSHLRLLVVLANQQIVPQH